MTVFSMLKCQHDDCLETQELTACFLPDNETDTPDEYFCTNHAFEHGFCYMCGSFNGGIESFEFAAMHGGVHGMCEQCSDQLEGDLSTDDDDDDNFYDY